jgi:hypothetical protein
MSVHIAWFKKNYPSNGKFIMVYPKQKMLDTAAHFDDDVSVLRTGKLNQLKKNVSSFFKEFQNDNFYSLSIDTINKRLEICNLLDKNVINDYYEPILNHSGTKVIS